MGICFRALFGIRYDRSTWERWYLYGKSAGLGTGGTNGEVGR